MQIRTNRNLRYWAWLLVLLSTFAVPANAQFSSGSTGADGALDYSNLPANSTVVFDPAKFSPSLHPPGLYVYNFTTINIPAGITVVFSGQLIKGPVFWLSQGDVLINGNIQASGQPGAPQTADNSVRVPAIPGPGGFFGGVGGNQSSAAQPGDGPLGGAAATSSSASGGNGGFSGNLLFAPPVGGSGGGGAFCPSATTFGEGGGAGGGALVIASSTTITVNGTIFATGGPTGGGQGCNGGGEGAGGAIKLAANTITGSGTIDAFGGDNLGIDNGAIRLEAFQILDHNLKFNQAPTEAAPGALFVPTQAVSIQIISVAGTPLPGEPSGSFASPDVVINTGSPVPVSIQTSGIPPGTVLTLNIYSEDGTTQTVQTTALQGTLQLATATASVAFPPDLSLGYLKATWTTTQ
jgi:hypothetical protein